MSTIDKSMQQAVSALEDTAIESSQMSRLIRQIEDSNMSPRTKEMVKYHLLSLGEDDVEVVSTPTSNIVPFPRPKPASGSNPFPLLTRASTARRLVEDWTQGLNVPTRHVNSLQRVLKETCEDINCMSFLALTREDVLVVRGAGHRTLDWVVTIQNRMRV